MHQNTVIGITGGSGSGKTHFLKRLLDAIPKESMTLFSMDNYYKPIEQQLKDENGVENFDRPESLDREAFFRDLKRLKQGETVTVEEYNFNHRDKKPRVLTFKPTPVIIVEGIFTFYYEEISNLLDLKIYIDTPDYLMLKRRIIRDAKERGYDLNDVLYRFEHHVTPAYRKFIRPLKDEADIIVPNHRNFDKALNVISIYIRQIS
jgi:uridine kinase